MTPAAVRCVSADSGYDHCVVVVVEGQWHGDNILCCLRET